MKLFYRTVLFLIIITICETTFAQKTSHNIFEAIAKPDSITTLYVSCPHHFPKSNRCDTIPETINRLTELKEFIASESNFSCLPNSFAQLNNLEYFVLSENYRFPKEELCKLASIKGLKGLSLGFLHYSSLPECLIQLTSLNYIRLYGMSNLNYNQCIEVFLKLPHLTFLSFPTNDIQQLPLRLVEMKKLKYLSLSYSYKLNIDTLSKIGKKMNLAGLELSHCSISDLPNNFKAFRNLKTLDLSENSLDSIPSVLSKFKKLRYLSLHNNNHHDDFKISKNIQELITLEYLDLSSNKINNLPESIGKLNALKFLNLYGSKVDNLLEVIPTIKNLKELNLDITRTKADEVAKLKALCPNLKITSIPNGQIEHFEIVRNIIETN